jgi:deferrochelatase/peroxidase EfeB
MPNLVLPLPLPRLESDFQPGVTDPIWPAMPPPDVDAGIYCTEYGGQLARQRYLHIITANVTVKTAEELQKLMGEVAYFANHQMKRTTPSDIFRAYDPQVENFRATVTVAYGATFFTTAQGDDRFGLAQEKPTWLKIIPPITGDDPLFSPKAHATDLIFLLASDDIYVNEYLCGLLYYGKVHPGIQLKSIERGYARPDSREPGGFEDGSSNPRDGIEHSAMHHFVYVKDGDDEPAWCRNGTYLAYRKIQRRLRDFFKLTLVEQEKLIGANKNNGCVIANAPPQCHKMKMNPLRIGPDILGINDDDRQILRRPYFYDDGLNEAGQELRGIHHLSFARNLALQYEWRLQMWQMNENFPAGKSGIDTLYSEAGGTSNVGGGYYFVPGLTDGFIRLPLDYLK